MNLVAALEKEHSKAQCEKIVDYVGKSPQRFAALVQLFVGGPYRITQRSAWPLSYCVERHPELITPHLKSILMFAKQPGVHPSVRRNAMRLLQFIDVPKHLQGLAMDLSFSFLQDTNEPIAVRVFAMAALVKLARVWPDLKNELIPIIEDQMPYSSPAFISRGRKALKALQAI